MGTKRWTDVEDDILRAYYGRNRSDWPGWDEVLPGRSARARRVRMAQITPPDGAAMRDKAVELFHTGLAPSVVDERLSLPAGTTHRMVIERWAYDKALV